MKLKELLTAALPANAKKRFVPPRRWVNCLMSEYCFLLSFTHVGVDFAGPLYVRDNIVKKTYVCIFTCASRMVHLGLTKDMSTSEFLQAFNRVIGRRGLCETMWSDNAKTFKSAEREIRKLYSGPAPNSRHLWSRINRDELMAQLSTKGIKWKFIVERAPCQKVRLKNLYVKC